MSTEARRGTGAPGARVKVGCEPPCACWELKSALCKDSVLLNWAILQPLWLSVCPLLQVSLSFLLSLPLSPSFPETLSVHKQTCVSQMWLCTPPLHRLSPGPAGLGETCADTLVSACWTWFQGVPSGGCSIRSTSIGWMELRRRFSNREDENTRSGSPEPVTFVPTFSASKEAQGGEVTSSHTPSPDKE